MSAQVQLEFFKETTEADVLKAELVALRESHNAVRRRVFAQQSEMTKMILRQQEELDYLKMKMGLTCIVQNKDAV